MTTTDTPRTDACPYCAYCGSIENDTEGTRTFYVCGTYHTKGFHPARSSLCREIEERNEWKERAERAEAEVERLKKELADWDYGTRAKREQARAERAEANLRRAIEIVEEVLDYHPSVEELFRPEEVEELDAIKATLNPTDK